MIFITGDTRSKEFVDILQSYGWGRMVISQKIQPYKDEPWGFDNGAWRDFKNGRKFIAADYLERVYMVQDLAEDYHPPYLSIVPDIVCGGYGSLAFSNYWVEQPQLELVGPLYLAVQNGMTFVQVEEAITSHKYAGIFIGGDDAFKRHTDRQWVELAHKYGLKCHYGRCGTKRKIRRAIGIGADSCDSVFPLWIRNRLESFIKSMYSVEKQEKITEGMA